MKFLEKSQSAGGLGRLLYVSPTGVSGNHLEFTAESLEGGRMRIREVEGCS